MFIYCLGDVTWIKVSCLSEYYTEKKLMRFIFIMIKQDSFLSSLSYKYNWMQYIDDLVIQK